MKLSSSSLLAEHLPPDLPVGDQLWLPQSPPEFEIDEPWPFADHTLSAVGGRCADLPADLDPFLKEAARALHPRGAILLHAGLVPYQRSRKKRVQWAVTNAGVYINSFLQLRNGRNHRPCLSLPEWEQRLAGCGLRLQANIVTEQVAYDFSTWTSMVGLSAADRVRLQVLLIQAPQMVRDFLTPEVRGDKIKFHLTNAFLLARPMRGPETADGE